MQVLDRVELIRQPATDGRPAGWLAQINGLTLPVVGYQVSDYEDGTALVTLAVAAASVRIGGQLATERGRTAARIAAAGGFALGGERGPRRPWGVADGPDPREGIPGWRPPEPSPGAQVAGPGEEVQG